MIYRLRYAFRLWISVPGMTLGEALSYPLDRDTFPECSPEEMADIEISYMHD